MMHETRVQTLIKKVQANKKYQSITIDLVRRLSEEALAKGLTGKSAVKAVRNKIHQVGGAYFNQIINYTEAEDTLNQLPMDLQSDEVRQFSIKTMQAHTSTAERLPILENFYRTCLAPIAPVESIFDLACGMNPLAIPWMPLAERFHYQACDVYLDMLGLINTFFLHYHINGDAHPCDLLGNVPAIDSQVTFLLKSIPCLEQVDKGIGPRLLDAIRSEHILVSFPVRSLGGRRKGMPEYYRDHFHEMVAGKTWHIREFNFNTELAFLVTK